jgi:hypothetical protein
VNFGMDPVALTDITSAWSGHAVPTVLLSSRSLPAETVIPRDVAVWWDTSPAAGPRRPE